MSSRRHVQSKLSRVLAFLCALSVLIGSFAFFTDKVSVQSETAVGNINLVFSDISASKTGTNGILSNNEFAKDTSWGNSLVEEGGNINPGDFFDLSFALSNLGSKSMDVRQQLTVAASIPMTEGEDGYQLTIKGGNDTVVVPGVMSGDKMSITYDLQDIVMNGSAEKEPGAVADALYQVRLDFLRTSPNEFMGTNLTVTYKAQAKQHRNTGEADWATWAEYETKFEQVADTGLYTVLTESSASGRISVSSRAAAAENNVTLTPVPATGYAYTGSTIRWEEAGIPKSLSLPANELTFTMPDAPVTITPSFSLATYSISYEVNEGVMPKSYAKNYTAETPTITLATPTKTDYEFAGWYAAPDFSGNALIKIPQGSEGDKMLYAKWNPKAYAMLYSDGTLVFQYGNTADPDHGELTKSFTGFVHADTTNPATPQWYSYTANVQQVIFKDEISPNSTYYWFNNMSNCTSMDLAKLDTRRTVLMTNMFYGCKSLTTLDVSGFNTSNVTRMYSMFYGCSRLESLDVSNFDTSSVTTMSSMFYGCSRLESLDVSNFDTSSVTNMSSMFDGCSSLESLDVSNFDTSSVTNMSSMFKDCSGLTELDVSGFDTSSVTNMSSLFEDCSSLESLDVSNFDTSSVTNMSSLFSGCSGLTELDVSGFDTSSVTTMSYMFSSCSSLESLDVSNFDTSSVTSMSHMFRNISGLTTLDLSSFNTSNVIGMNYMFMDCSGLTTLNLNSFDTALVTNMSYMFSGCSGLTALDVTQFNTSSVTNMSSMFYGCSSLESLDVSNFDTSSVTNMSSLFSGCSGLTALDVTQFNTSSVTNMSSMFKDCSGLTELDVSGFDTAKVTDMSIMFSGCSGLTTLNLNSFNTSNVRYLYSMFENCSNLKTIYVASDWPTTKIYSGGNMFKGCVNLRGWSGGITYNESKTDHNYAKRYGGYFT